MGALGTSLAFRRSVSSRSRLNGLQSLDFSEDPAPSLGAGVGAFVRQLIRAARGKVAGAAAMLLDHEQGGRLNIPVRHVGHADSLPCRAGPLLSRK